MNEPNSDLLLWLCELALEKDLSAFDMRKIKSHLKDEDAESNLHLYHVLGNRLADQVAVKVLNRPDPTCMLLVGRLLNGTWTKKIP